MARSARETARIVLSACRREGAWSDGRLKEEIGKSALSRVDAALCTRICYGVMQNMALLDFYLSRFCTASLKKLEPRVLDILRIGAYQILYMDKVPDSAAVNEAVKSAKGGSNPRSSALVNGVLRALSRGKESLPQLSCDTKQEYLALKYSHPLWLTSRFFDEFGRGECEQLLAANNTPSPTTVQINPLKATVEQAVNSLEKDGVTVKEHSFLSGCLVISDTGSIEALEAFRLGYIQVQDPAARMAALAAGPMPGMLVVDGCSAPGGKSFACAQMMENKGEIYSFDIYQHKIELIEKGARRLGADIIIGEQRDARCVKKELTGSADVVIADVPCSGMGTIRKKPDVRYKREEDVAQLPKVQLEILTSLSQYVKPGGVLIYSTCTVFRRENRDVVDSFLEKNKDFSLESFTLPGVGPCAGDITLLPHIHDTDGFYICRLRRDR